MSIQGQASGADVDVEVASGPAPRRTFRFDSLFNLLLERLSSDLGGVSKTDVIRFAVRELAKARGVS